ncbi:MAG: hypothetical protein ACKO8U_09850, partial [Pirellula sp.]
MSGCSLFLRAHLLLAVSGIFIPMIRFNRIVAIVLFSWLAQTSSLLAEYQGKPQEPATNEPAPTETKVQDPKPVAETEKRLEAIEKLLEQVSGEL